MKAMAVSVQEKARWKKLVTRMIVLVSYHPWFFTFKMICILHFKAYSNFDENIFLSFVATTCSSDLDCSQGFSCNDRICTGNIKYYNLEILFWVFSNLKSNESQFFVFSVFSFQDWLWVERMANRRLLKDVRKRK